MAHQQQIDFCLTVKARLPVHFSGRLVLDIGSLDINGNNQYLFDDCLYLGADLSLGRNVDLASKGHELGFPDASIDVVVSTECFEHDQHYRETLNNIVRMLKPGGLFLFTCATTGRPEHGTRRTTPQDAPFTQQFDDWSDYYRNLTEGDIREVIDVDAIFSESGFSTNSSTHDLYFWGVKAGTREDRGDYSFLLDTNSQRRAAASLREALQAQQQQTLVGEQALASLREALQSQQQQALTDGQALVSLRDALHAQQHRATVDSQVLAELRAQIAQQAAERLQQKKEGEDLAAAVAAMQVQLSDVYASRSWGVTRPLRAVSRWVRKKN